MPNEQQVLFRDPGPLETGFSHNGADDLPYAVWHLLERERTLRETVLAVEDICPFEVVRSLYDICDYFRLNSIVMCHSVTLLQRLAFTSVRMQPNVIPLTVAIAAKMYRRDATISQRRLRSLLLTLGYRSETNQELFITEQRILVALNFDIECNAIPEWIGTLLGALVLHPSADFPELADFNWSHLLQPSLDLAVVYFARRREMPDRLRTSPRLVALAIIVVVHMLVIGERSPHFHLVKALCRVIRERNDTAVMQDAFSLLNLFNVPVQQHNTNNRKSNKY